MDTSYLKLLKGSRLTNYMGLEVLEGYEYNFGKNYLHLDFPIVGAVLEDGTVTLQVKRNQHVWVRAAASVNVRGRNFIDVEPNSALAEVGQVQGLYRIHPESGKKELGFWLTARKDIDLSGYEYGVRIYMPA